jgi:hypothetical protein
MELHSFMSEHTAGNGMDLGSDRSDISCCTMELGGSTCNSICDIIGDNDALIFQTWMLSDRSYARRELWPGIDPDPALRPPRFYSMRGGMPRHA